MFRRSSSWGLKTDTTQPNPFAEAIREFIDELKAKEDKNSRFFKEVLLQSEKLKRSTDSRQPHLSAEALLKCISDLDAKQKRESKFRGLLKWLQPFVDGMLQYTNVVDTMIQADPTAGALLYGGAKLILQLASGFSEYFDRILDAMKNVGIHLKLFEIYTKVDSRSWDMNRILVESYKNILRFWQTSAKVLTRNTGKTFFSAIVIRPFKATCQNFETQIENDAKNAHYYAQASGALAASKHQAAFTSDREESKRKGLLEWLSASKETVAIDVRTDLEKFYSVRHQGTCEWLFKDQTFSEWQNSKEGDILWIRADPGAGKSVLCSTLVNKLQSQGFKVAYFFCAYDDPPKRKIISVLRSLAVQLIKYLPQIPDELYHVYKNEDTQGYSCLNNTSVAESVLQVLLRGIDRVHIVLDGLDECEDRDGIKRTLHRLFQNKAYGVVKWVWSSRSDLEFQQLSTEIGSKVLGISKEASKGDIRTLLLDEPTIACEGESRVEHWTEASEGNFLWMRLTLETLQGHNSTCDEELEEELGNFNAGLTPCYYRALHHLLTKPKKHQQLARKIFIFVVLAVQPLTFNELAEALAVQPESFDLSPGRIPRRDVIDALCRPLLDFDRSHDYLNPTLRFTHKTVRDFLWQDPKTLEIHEDCWKFFVKPSRDQEEFGKVCLTYLSYKRYRSPFEINTALAVKPLTNHAFLIYAALFWYRHLDLSPDSSELFKAVSGFLRSSNYWTCMHVQSKYAPFSFGSYTERRQGFTINNPDCFARHGNTYIADPLPHWLEHCDEGGRLVKGYQSFVKEWGRVLVKHPDQVWQCCPGILGGKNIFRKVDGSEHVTAVSVFQNSESESPTSVPQRQPEENSADSEASSILLSYFQHTDTGIRAVVATTEEKPTSIKFSIVEWLAPFPPSNNAIASICDSTRIASLVNGEFNWDAAVVTRTVTPKFWTLDVKNRAFRCIDLSSEINVDVSIGALKTPQFPPFEKGELRMADKSTCSHRNKTAISFILQNLQEDGQSDDDDSAYESDESEASTKKYARGLHYLAVLDEDSLVPRILVGGTETSWERSRPAFHPKRPIIVYAADDTSLLVGDTDSRTTVAIRTPISKVSNPEAIVSKDYHFTQSGAFLCEVTTTKRTHKDIVMWKATLQIFPVSEASPNDLGFTMQPSTCCHSLTWGCSKSLLNVVSGRHPFRLSWDTEHLYIAFGIHELTIHRLSLASDSEKAISTLSTSVFLPCSASSRNTFSFFPLNVNDKLYFAFALGATQDLPAAILWRSLEELNGWTPYEEKDEQAWAQEWETERIKGVYVPEEQRFSIPIRSGLEWKKRTYITC